MAEPVAVSIVYPAFNEEAVIERTVRETVKVLDELGYDYEVVIVNDGSKDRTHDILEALSKEFSQVRAIHFPQNRGYSKALKEGFANAQKEFIFYSDSDMQFRIEELPRLVELIPDCDLAVGYRIDRKDPPQRLFAAWGYNNMARRIFGIKGVRDIDCAFKLFRRHVFDKISIESEQFVFDTEILAKAMFFGFTIKEVGVTHLPRTLGQSTVRFSHIVNTLKGVWKLKKELHAMKDEQPANNAG